MEEEKIRQIGISDFVQALIKNRILLALSIFGFAIIFFIYSFFGSEIYQSKSIVFTSFGQELEGPFGSFELENQSTEDYLSLFDLDGERDRGLSIEYDFGSYDDKLNTEKVATDSEDGAVIFTVSHKQKDSLIPMFNRVFKRFCKQVDHYLKEEAFENEVFRVKRTLNECLVDEQELQSFAEYLVKIRKQTSLENLSQNQFSMKGGLPIGENMKLSPYFKFAILDSVIVMNDVEIASLKSKIDKHTLFIDSLNEESSQARVKDFSMSDQVLNTYLPIQAPQKLGVDWLSKTILGGFIGLVIGGFIVFFRTASATKKD